MIPELFIELLLKIIPSKGYLQTLFSPYFLLLAMGLAALEVMQAVQRTWTNSKVRMNGKTRLMQWRDGNWHLNENKPEVESM